MKVCIFDLDGTLLDSMGIWINIDTAFLNKRNIEVPDDYADIIAPMSFNDAAMYTIDRFNLHDNTDELIKEWEDLAIYEYSNTVKMKPYSKAYLQNLKELGIKIAVATSSMPILYEAALRNNNIYDLFDVICNTGDIGAGKSQPDIFLRIAEKFNVSPRDCVVFEDILVAIKSAKSIGMTVYGVYDKASENDWKQIKKIADGVIYDFKNAPLPKK